MSKRSNCSNLMACCFFLADISVSSTVFCCKFLHATWRNKQRWKRHSAHRSWSNEGRLWKNQHSWSPKNSSKCQSTHHCHSSYWVFHRVSGVQCSQSSSCLTVHFFWCFLCVHFVAPPADRREFERLKVLGKTGTIVSFCVPASMS